MSEKEEYVLPPDWWKYDKLLKKARKRVRK
ncbi:hypothetical protein MJ1HA_0172 [Metallosphaera sedula]|nr:hypothetical protein MJ1HA_0093 [Metallosphaera sedula]BBL46080.1 hypothetical protein MJ1HA_0172 [Metallosphaera sedula]